MVTLPGAHWTPDFKPMWRKPPMSRMVKSWPPVKYIDKKYARDCTSFWSLANACDRKNPWDIIIYNFNTEEPKEVNWYLHHAVGCWTSSDSRNFAFDYARTADSKDGLIYIPSPGWKPDPKFKKGSGAGGFVHAMVADVYTIMMRIARSIPRIQFGNTQVGPASFEELARLVNTREIAIEVEPSLGPRAKYTDKKITLRKAPSIRRYSDYGTLANEGTHAITHRQSRKVEIFKNETTSSLTQSVVEAAMSENRVLRLMEYVGDGYDKLYFAGWVWSNYLRDTVILSMKDLDRDFPHPIHGDMRNPKQELLQYMHKAGYIDSGRKIAFDWDI